MLSALVHCLRRPKPLSPCRSTSLPPCLSQNHPAHDVHRGAPELAGLGVGRRRRLGCSLLRRLVLLITPPQALQVCNRAVGLRAGTEEMPHYRTELQAMQYNTPNRLHPRTSAAAEPILSRAAATTAGSRPSRCAMLSALLRPGMPHSSLRRTASRARQGRRSAGAQVQLLTVPSHLL